MIRVRLLLRIAALSVGVAAVLAVALLWRSFESLSGRGATSAAAAWVCRRFCALLRLEVRTRTPEALDGPALIAVNHVSWTDPLLLGSWPGVCFLAKKEVASWPIFGWLTRLQGSVFVERGRRMAIPRVNGEIADRLAAGRAVTIFAEATTSDGTRVLKFHSSHFEAAADCLRRRPDLPFVDVRPAALVYLRRDGLPLGRAGRAALAWYGDTDFAPHFAALVAGGPVQCELAFAPAIRFYRGDSRKQAAAQAEAAVRALASRRFSAQCGAESAVSRRTRPPAALDPPFAVADSPIHD